MSTQHTPGPWEIHVQNNVGFPSITTIGPAHPDFGQVCRVFEQDTQNDGGNHEPTVLANAHLIAAAPELLAALENAQKQFDAIAAAVALGHTVSISSVQNCAAYARAAIAKAEGRTA